MVTAKRWDCYARFYDLLLKSMAAERAQLFQRLDLSQPLQIYLAGCGSGLDLPYLPAQSAVLAVDFSAEMLKHCESLQQKLDSQGHQLDLTLRQSKAELSGLVDQSVDLVILHLILAVTDNPQGLLQEAVRVLKPGGKISIWDKFVPPNQSISMLRRFLDFFSRKLGTTLLLQIDTLLQGYSLAIIQRQALLGGQMQHLLLQKATQEEPQNNRIGVA